MAQARRNTNQANTASRGQSAWLNFLFLLIGLICGSLLTNLYNGYHQPPVELGQGLKQITSQLRNVAPERSAQPSDPAPPPEEKEPTLDFYTVLPEREQVVNSFVEEKPAEAAKPDAPKEPAKDEKYILQVASFNDAQDADQLRAKLALLGIQSHIQKVSIEGKGTFMRVRVGPFNNASDAQRIDAELKNNGFSPLRLKVSGAE